MSAAAMLEAQVTTLVSERAHAPSGPLKLRPPLIKSNS
jgi:hypothetical protein